MNNLPFQLLLCIDTSLSTIETTQRFIFIIFHNCAPFACLSATMPLGKLALSTEKKHSIKSLP